MTSRLLPFVKFILFTCFYLVYSLISIGQGVQQKYVLDITGRRPDYVNGCRGANGELFYLLESGKSLEWVLVDSTLSQQTHKTGLKPDQAPNGIVLQCRLNESAADAIVFNKGSKELWVSRLQRSTGQISQHKIFKLGLREHYLSSFVHNEMVYCLSLPSDSAGYLNIKRFGFDNKTQSYSLFIPYPHFHGQLKTANRYLNQEPISEYGIDLVTQGLENSLRTAQGTIKLYSLSNSICLSFDKEEECRLYWIALDSMKLNEVVHRYYLDGGATRQGNSFLLNDTLYRASINSNVMEISIKAARDTAHAWKRFLLFPDSAFIYKNGPYLEQGGGETRAITKQIQFFNRVANGHIAIAANDLGEIITIESGSFQVFTTGAGGSNPNWSVSMGVGVGSMGMGYPGGMYAPYGYGFPGYYSGYPGYYPGYSSFDNFTSLESLWMTTVLDSTLQHVPIPAPISMRERLNTYNDQVFRKGFAENALVLALPNNRLILGYYLKNTNKYQLVVFP
jgi:hypothetical protein